MLRTRILLLIPLMALLVLLGVPVTGVYAETLPPMNVSIPQYNMPPADGLDGVCQWLVNAGVYKTVEKCKAELGTLKMPNLLPSASVPAGRDFYAGQVLSRPDGWQYLTLPTNYNKCDPNTVDFKVEYDVNSNISAQWPHCVQLNVQGGPGQFKFFSRLANPGAKYSWMITGDGGSFSVDNGTTWMPFHLKAGALEIPQAGNALIWVKLADDTSYFSAELKKGTLDPSGNFELKVVENAAPWQRLMKGSLTGDNFCAWAMQLILKETPAGVSFDFPECIKMVGSGTGTIVLRIRGDPAGFNTVDQFRLGVALWPMGSGGSYSVWKDGKKICPETSLDKGSAGINVRPNVEFELQITLADGHYELPLGEVRMDQVKNVVVAPVCNP